MNRYCYKSRRGNSVICVQRKKNDIYFREPVYGICRIYDREGDGRGSRLRSAFISDARYGTVEAAQADLDMLAMANGWEGVE